MDNQIKNSVTTEKENTDGILDRIKPSQKCPNLPTYNFNLHGKRDFEEVIKLKTLRHRDDPGLTRWAQCNHKCLRKRGWEALSERRHGDRSRGEICR